MSGPARNEASQHMPGKDTNALASRLSTGGADGASTAPATARWGALTASLGVILLDFSALKDVAGDTSPAALQALCLEQVYAMLDRALRNGVPGTDAARGRQPAMSSSSAAKQRSALTPRQQDILREVASGKSNVEIARTLHISVETVKTHMQQILMRLEARNRTELVAMYQQAVHGRGRGQ